MAIIYNWYENPTNGSSEEEVGLHPRPVGNHKWNMEALCKRIHEDCALSMGNVKSVLDSLARLCAEGFYDGREIHVEGLGFFAPTLEVSERVTHSTKYKHTKVRLKSVSFRPDVRLKRELTDVHFKQYRNSLPAKKLNEWEIDELLWQHFDEKDTLRRTEFQRLCHLSQATANRHLKRLREAGKLKNIGEERHPVYVRVPGSYGLSRDV